jgi:hypothetical protein
MAAYHLHVSSGSKSSGKGAGGKARYLLRSGPYATARERAQEGNTVGAAKIDKSAELVFAESGNMPSWAADEPLRFWDASDTYERANGSTYREVEIALPRELSIDQQIALAQAFAKEVATVEGGVTPWTLAVHQQDADHPEHRHVHILLSDRIMDGKDRTPETFFKRWNAKEAARGGARKAQERQEAKKKVGETWAAAKWTDRLRPLWESMANDALQHAGVEARIDHRTLDAQRIEMEQQAGHTRTPELAPAYRRLAEALDRPPEPKKGRVLTHAGPEQAPERAGLLIEYERAKAERQALLAARREAEREAAEIERKESILRKAQARQQERDPFDRMKIRGRWERRQKARQNRQRDAETAAEQRPGIRHPERPQWQVYRERMLTEAYNQDVAQTLGRWVRVERVEHGLHLHNREMDLTDYGDRIVAGLGGKEREIEAMLQLARAKGWQRLELTGSTLFQERAGAAALAAGFDLADAALKERILEGQRQEAEAREAAIRAQAPVLGQWMQDHPKLAALMKVAGRRLPGAPAGVEDWSPDAWSAADGREAALHAWAQQGLGLRIGKEAPSPAPAGLVWTLGRVVTREAVGKFANAIQERKARSHVSHELVVTFAPGIPADQRVLVYEHLLRNNVAVQRPGPGQAGRAQYESAQERLRTHRADGREQRWVIEQREREARIAREKAEREAREREEQQRREAEKRREAERQKLREAARELGREVGRRGESEERKRKAAALLAEGRRLDVTDLGKPYNLGLAEGRKEAALEACREAGAAIQRSGGEEDRAWEQLQAQARQAVAAAEKLGITRKDAEGALYAGRDAVAREQERLLSRSLGPGF